MQLQPLTLGVQSPSASGQSAKNSKVKPSPSTIKFVEGISFDDLAKAQVAIPFDSPGLFSDWILRSIKCGFLTASNIELNGEIIGTITYYIHEGVSRIFNVCSLHLSKNYGQSFTDILNKSVDQLGKSRNCDFVKFSTVRKGLIKTALSHGWEMSEIVLVKKL